MRNIHGYRQSTSVKIILAIFFITFVFYPFLQMILNIESEDWQRVITSPVFCTAALNSVRVALTTTMISVSIALILAFCLQRSNIRFKAILSVFLITPMLIPSISHGMGLIVLFGTNGIVTNLLGLNTTIYGFKGIVAGAVLYTYPIAFLMLNDVLKYEDSSPYEAATVLGIPKLRQITAITLPYLFRPIISAIFSVFTLAMTDYGIALMIGGKCTTLSVLMYQEVLGQLDFGQGSVVGLFLLIPAVVTFIFNTFFKGDTKLSFVTKPFELKASKIRDSFAYVFCFFVLICIISLLGAFCIVAFTAKYPSDLTFTLANVAKTFTLRGDRYLLNSITISVFVSIIGAITAFITAYLTTRMPSKLSQVLHLCSITTLAIPGMVLGLSYALTFSGSFLYGTIAILVMANLMHFFSSPYLMMYNSLSKLNENLESVGQTLGISRMRMIKDVILPQSKSTIYEMISYFFVNSMVTISAVSFLETTATKPISLLINQFEAQMQYECAAVVSLIILLINVCIKSIVYVLQRKTEY